MVGSMTVREFLVRWFVDCVPFKEDALDDKNKLNVNVAQVYPILMILRHLNGEPFINDNKFDKYKCNCFNKDVEVYCKGAGKYDFQKSLKKMCPRMTGGDNTVSVASRMNDYFIMKNSEIYSPSDEDLLDDFCNKLKEEIGSEGKDDYELELESVLNTLSKQGFVRDEYKEKMELIKNFLLEKKEDDDMNNTEKSDGKSYYDKVIDLITTGDVKQIIFTGAPGTGKTRTAKKIAEELGEDLKEGKNNKEKD